MGRFDGKVVIVTGAGRGIGRAHARAFAVEGAAVLVNDPAHRPGSDAVSVVAEITAAGGIAEPDTHSATLDGAEAIVAHALEAFGRVDALVNNATAFGNGDLWRLAPADWERTIAVNLSGYFAMTRAVVPALADAGGGAIVNTSSQSGFGHPSLVAYSAAKEGVIGLTRTTAKEVGRFGIRANAIRPVAITPGVTEYHGRANEWLELMDLTMGARTGGLDPEKFSPAKIAPFVVWLCSAAAHDVNGRTFLVMGDRITLLTEPEPAAAIAQRGGWTLDALDEIAPRDLVAGLENPFRLDGHPHLQGFPD